MKIPCVIVDTTLLMLVYIILRRLRAFEWALSLQSIAGKTPVSIVEASLSRYVNDAFKMPYVTSNRLIQLRPKI